jgi:hypothetical protein
VRDYSTQTRHTYFEEPSMALNLHSVMENFHISIATNTKDE